MPETLLQTKLFVPPLRPNLVPRPELIQRLNAGLQLGHKLTLVCAPAGFGKTTLAAEWVGQMDESTGFQPSAFSAQPFDSAQDKPFKVAWLSLDEGDNDPTRFLTYLVTALQTVAGEIGQGVLAMLQSPQPPPAESILTALVNEMAAMPEAYILVLDDYHLIQPQVAGASSQVDNIVTFLLNHQPPQMHLVMATREDPDLPLPRLRARGQLTELRAADLRFSSSEAADFLNRAMGLNLSAENVAALDRRTEGWIAGLQLAAVALQSQKVAPVPRDATTFINAFSGSHQFVLDYLIEEVLEQQPEEVQTFLQQTAVLDRLNGALCDALTGQHDGQETLQTLERANLFIIGLDAERRWYRYHHLFADLLRRRLQQQHPDWRATLYQKASGWYERNRLPAEAIEYALRAEDFARAARMLEECLDTFWGSGKHVELQRWLNALPEGVLLSSPHLAIFQARYQCNNGKLDHAEETLAAAERALDPSIDQAQEEQQDSQGTRNRPDRLKLQGRAKATRALMCSYQGDVAGIIRYGDQALALLPEDDLTWRSVTALTLGNAYGFMGDMTAAYEARFKALQSCRMAGDRYFIMIANLQLAITLREQGRLGPTIEICEQQFQAATESGLAQTSIAGWLLAIWGETLAEMNVLDEALEKVEKGFALAERGRDLQMLGWSLMCLVRVLFSRGELDEASEIIRQMEDRARQAQIPPWIAERIASWQARIWLVEGKLEAASRWAEAAGLSVSDELRPAEEIGFFLLFDYLTLARILNAQGCLAEATKLLGHLHQVAEARGRTSSVIEIKALQALTCQAHGDIESAFSALEGALILAEPEGFARVFVDEGLLMATLLTKFEAAGAAPKSGRSVGQAGEIRAFTQRLLAAFDGQKDSPMPTVAQPAAVRTRSEQALSQQALLEPLSERELEVLELVAEGLTNREIASRLYLSLNTVKVHTRNIYGKLGVHSRTQAIARAQELELLPFRSI